MLLKKFHVHIANIPHYNIRIPVYGIYLYFTAMDKPEIRHMLYILPLTSYLTRTVKSRITLNAIVFAPYVLEKSFWIFFFYRICKLIYSLEDNKLCFVIPFTVYQSLTF